MTNLAPILIKKYNMYTKNHHIYPKVAHKCISIQHRCTSWCILKWNRFLEYPQTLRTTHEQDEDYNDPTSKFN